VVYPLARTWPALIVVIVSFSLGRGDAITWMVVLGILLILAGSTALPLGGLRELRISTYANASCAYALLAAVGTAGYTLVDDAGLRKVTSALELPDWQIVCMWLGYESLATVIWLKTFEKLRFLQASGEVPLQISRWRAILVASAMGSTYALVLISYTLVDDVSYVAGFRQLSVPLGAIAGIVLLREPGPTLKLIGVALMFSGLVLIALG
jgi:drug/metabolite transporter (DMT)-like permease